MKVARRLLPTPVRFGLVAVTAFVVAILSIGPAAAQDTQDDSTVGQSVETTPQTIDDLTPEERSWMVGDNTIWCSFHPEFRTCVLDGYIPMQDEFGRLTPGRPAQIEGYTFPSDGTLYTAKMSGETNGLDLYGPQDALKDFSNSVFGEIAQDIGRFAGDILVESMVWWIKTDSINVEYAATLTGEKPIQQLVGFIMVAGVLVSAIMMMVSRRTQPAAELLMGGVKYILIAGLSMAVLKGLITATDEIAKSLITGGATEFGDRVATMLGLTVIHSSGGVIFLGLITALLSFIQWVMGFARQAGILILYALLIIAAAGQLTPWGRQWFPRIAGACVALVMFKPIAAILYTVGFKLIGEEQTMTTLVTGIMVIALAVIALPSLMAFFAWTGAQLGGGTGAGTVLAGGAVLGAAAGNHFAGGGSGGGGGGGGEDHSSYMDANGPGQNGEVDPSPGNTGGKPPEAQGGASGAGTSATEAPEVGVGSGPSEAPSDGPGTPGESDAAAAAPQTPDLDASSMGSGAAGAGAAGGAAGAGAAGGAAATGGASLAVEAGVKAIGMASDAAESTAAEMTPDDTGPDM